MLELVPSISYLLRLLAAAAHVVRTIPKAIERYSFRVWIRQDHGPGWPERHIAASCGNASYAFSISRPARFSVRTVALLPSLVPDRVSAISKRSSQ